MKSAVMAVMLALAATAAFGQDLAGLKAIYARKCEENVEAYGKTLDAALEILKAKGDLEGFLAVESEKKRFGASGTVAPTNSSLEVATAKAGYDAAALVLLRMYVPALDKAVRDAVRAGNLGEAKVLKGEMDRASFEMADIEAKVPKAEDSAKDYGPEKTNGMAPVAARKPVLKEATAYSGHHYLLVSDKKTWNEAKISCEEMGGHLAVISGKAENDFVRKMVEEDCWIGLSKVSGKSWEWMDGSKTTYVKWCEGFPQSGGDCVRFGHMPNGWNWANDAGDKALKYVCEWDY